MQKLICILLLVTIISGCVYAVAHDGSLTGWEHPSIVERIEVVSEMEAPRFVYVSDGTENWFSLVFSYVGQAVSGVAESVVYAVNFVRIFVFGYIPQEV